MVANQKAATMSKTIKSPRSRAVQQEGYSAGQRGVKRKDNPYPVPSHDALLWERGWADQRKKSRPRGKGLLQRRPTLPVDRDKPCD
jgi:hypothetical protein